MKICIDAGHNYSGPDTGAQGNGLREQDVTFPIAAFLRDFLTAAGVSVVMTRLSLTSNLGTDLNGSLNARAKISNDNKCDLFISIHCNAGGGTGTEVLVYRLNGGTAHKLAEVICSSVSGVLGLKSRGVKEQNVAVLRLTDAPAVLVETAFIDTAADAAKLRDRQYDFAMAVFAGVCDFYGIKLEDDVQVNESEVKEMRYQKVEHLPDWARPTVEKLIANGCLNGNESGELNLSEDMVRVFVVLDRAKVFG
jgi:N-acetylmuramoyl-L-alanine amidase